MHVGTWHLSSQDTSDLIFASPAGVTVELTIRKKGDPDLDFLLQVNGEPLTNGAFRHGELARTFRLASVNTLHLVADAKPSPVDAAGEYEITILES
jgi:hypothetical protein